MSFNIDTFRGAMAWDGARPNLFQISLRFPTWLGAFGTEAGQEISFKANSTQLPPSILGVARLNYFGREVKFPGDRVFPDWTINVINEENFLIRDSFEAWSNAINNHQSIVRNRNARNGSYGGYSVDALVTQFSKTGDPIKSYQFVGLFPTQIDPINVAWNANDQIEEFGVTFSYQYWLDYAAGGYSNTTPFI